MNKNLEVVEESDGLGGYVYVIKVKDNEEK